jgi:hypothetical protein
MHEPSTCPPSYNDSPPFSAFANPNKNSSNTIIPSPWSNPKWDQQKKKTRSTYSFVYSEPKRDESKYEKMRKRAAANANKPFTRPTQPTTEDPPPTRPMNIPEKRVTSPTPTPSVETPPAREEAPPTSHETPPSTRSGRAAAFAAFGNGQPTPPSTPPTQPAEPHQTQPPPNPRRPDTPPPSGFRCQRPTGPAPPRRYPYSNCRSKKPSNAKASSNKPRQRSPFVPEEIPEDFPEDFPEEVPEEAPEAVRYAPPSVEDVPLNDPGEWYSKGIRNWNPTNWNGRPIGGYPLDPKAIMEDRDDTGD